MDTQIENVATQSKQVIVVEKKAKRAPNKRPEPKGRAKNNLLNVYEKKNLQNPFLKKESKPVNTIGDNKFKGLLSMFDKSKVEDKENVNDVQQPNKLDFSRCSTFTRQDSIGGANNGPREFIMSEGLKKKMELYLENNKQSKITNPPHFDPVIKQRYQNDEENDESLAEEDLAFSDEEENNEKEHSITSEKQDILEDLQGEPKEIEVEAVQA